MARKFKVGDKIRLKPHTELGLKEYTWGAVVDVETYSSANYPYRVKVMGNPSGLVEGNIWSKGADGYYTWIAKDEYVDAKVTANKFK